MWGLGLSNEATGKKGSHQNGERNIMTWKDSGVSSYCIPCEVDAGLATAIWEAADFTSKTYTGGATPACRRS